MAYHNTAISGSTFTRTALKTGRRPPPSNTKVFPPGAILFEEGEKGRELFIITEGEISIYKGKKEDEVELARLGTGAIIGEMSLLDSLPRSASARVIKETKTVIINEVTFNAVSKLLPVWLTSIIKIITSRLRDTNKSIGLSILKDRQRGLAKILSIMIESEAKKSPGADINLDYYDILSEAIFITRLKRGDIDNNLNALEDKGLIKVTPVEGTRLIGVPDRDGLDFFVEFQTFKEQNKMPPALKLDENAQKAIKLIIAFIPVIGTAKEHNIFFDLDKLHSGIKQKLPTFTPAWLQHLRVMGILKLIPVEGKPNGQYVTQRASLERVLKSIVWFKKFQGDS